MILVKFLFEYFDQVLPVTSVVLTIDDNLKRIAETEDAAEFLLSTLSEAGRELYSRCSAAITDHVMIPIRFPRHRIGLKFG